LVVCVFGFGNRNDLGSISLGKLLVLGPERDAHFDFLPVGVSEPTRVI